MKNRWSIYLPLALLLALGFGIARNGAQDLMVYYRVSERLALFGAADFYSHSHEMGNFFYGPLSFPFFRPFSLLPFPVMKVLYTALQAAAYVVFWWALFQLFPRLKEKRYFPLFLLVWIFSIKSIHLSFQCYNVQLFIGATLLCAELLCRSDSPRRQFWGGFLVAPLAFIKVFPALVGLYYLGFRSRATRRGVVAGGLLSGLFPLLWYGPSLGLDLTLKFLGNLRGYQEYYPIQKDVPTLSLGSLVARWASELAPASAIYPLVIGISFLALVALALSFYRYRDVCREYPTFSWACVLAAMVFINPTSRPDYFLFYLAAVAALGDVWLARPRPKWVFPALLLSLMPISLCTEWVLGSRQLNHELELLRVPVLGMMGLVALLISTLIMLSSRNLTAE